MPKDAKTELTQTRVSANSETETKPPTNKTGFKVQKKKKGAPKKAAAKKTPS